MEAIILLGLLYIVADFIIAMIADRCLLPGLKCPACRIEKCIPGELNKEGS